MRLRAVKEGLAGVMTDEPAPPELEAQMADEAIITKAVRHPPFTAARRRMAAQIAAQKERQRVAWVKEMDEMPAREGLCYFVRGDDGPIKIGFSGDPWRRCRELSEWPKGRKLRPESGVAA